MFLWLTCLHGKVMVLDWCSMGNIKFQIITGLFIVLVGAVGFFALKSLRNPETYIKEGSGDTVGSLRGDEEVPGAPVTPADSGDGTGTVSAGTGAGTTTGGTTTGTGTSTTTGGTTSTTGLKYADLISRLEKAKSAGIVYKVGSKGAAVGAIQEFLNLYENKTSPKPDNDYGDGTAARIKVYQKANALPVTGQTAEKTLTKMIDWLKAKG